MPLFRRSSTNQDSEENSGSDSANLQLGQETREALEAGRLPSSALNRIAVQGAENSSSFTSDFSVSEFLLMKQSGLTPITQVLGACVYRVGYYQFPAYGRGTIKALEDAHNNARSLAFSRMLDEAKAANADVVAGVRFLENSLELSGDTLSYSIIGTAMKAPEIKEILTSTNGSLLPVLTTLSGQELAKLLAGGFIPLGVVAHTSVLFTALSLSTLQAMRYIYSGGGNFEVPEFTQCYYDSKREVMGRISERAKAMGSSGIVGADLKIRSRGYTISQVSGDNPDSAIYTAEMVATAVGEVEARAISGKARLVVSMKS